MENQLKGRTMLKVVGIIYIVFAAITIIGGLVIMIGGGFLAVRNELIDAGTGALFVVAGVITILSSLFSLVFGILGVRWCGRADKAQTLFMFGIVLIVLSTFGFVSNFNNGGSTVVGGLGGLVLSILFTLGAYWNKQSAA